ncbi:uncharacterized protein PV06_00441 [Exophiala oligosperma]|uniref:Sulphur transport domain-containing protein n=1 Tax=Exophiala oligosperma TaxID=215243 RepID=A0A0D2DXE5_9EURO|nr:uncharacterized protein PV06_00441 [Exophiala oligosperma]KIW47778.1 hypothetical protein PV06_00441 [Exophiala oligosperma]
MFTPVESALGAILLQQASTALLFNNGCVLGASGQLRGILTGPTFKTSAFIAGMALSVFVTKTIFPTLIPHYDVPQQDWNDSLWIVGLGTLTGYGTKSCNGCTSGHMLCGVSRLSARSLIATLTFMVVAYVTHQYVVPSSSTKFSSSNCPAGVDCYAPVYPNSDLVVNLVLAITASIVSLHLIPSIVFRVANKSELAGLASRLLVGFTFGFGLLVSGFADPVKVLSFFSVSFGPLDITAWDPSLGFVGLFAIVPNIIWWNFATAEPPNSAPECKGPPKYNRRYELPTTSLSSITLRFMIGAVLFGVSWGASGSCPGPAILRTLVQPWWGVLWMEGFLMGSLIPF